MYGKHFSESNRASHVDNNSNTPVLIPFTISTMKSNIIIHANSVDPHETTHTEPSHQDPLCFSPCYW